MELRGAVSYFTPCLAEPWQTNYTRADLVPKEVCHILIESLYRWVRLQVTQCLAQGPASDLWAFRSWQMERLPSLTAIVLEHAWQTARLSNGILSSREMRGVCADQWAEGRFERAGKRWLGPRRWGIHHQSQETELGYQGSRWIKSWGFWGRMGRPAIKGDWNRVSPCRKAGRQALLIQETAEWN